MSAARSVQCATYIRQLNHMRRSLISQHARESAQDPSLGEAIDVIARAIQLLEGEVDGVKGYDC